MFEGAPKNKLTPEEVAAKRAELGLDEKINEAKLRNAGLQLNPDNTVTGKLSPEETAELKANLSDNMGGQER